MNVATATLLANPAAVRAGKTSPAEVAVQFEALLLTQMFNAMQKTVEKSGLLGGGPAEEMYREMLNQALSGELARRGGLGLAEQIAHQIESYRGIEEATQTSQGADGGARLRTDE